MLCGRWFNKRLQHQISSPVWGAGCSLRTTWWKLDIHAENETKTFNRLASPPSSSHLCVSWLSYWIRCRRQVWIWSIWGSSLFHVFNHFETFPEYVIKWKLLQLMTNLTVMLSSPYLCTWCYIRRTQPFISVCFMSLHVFDPRTPLETRNKLYVVQFKKKKKCNKTDWMRRIDSWTRHKYWWSNKGTGTDTKLTGEEVTTFLETIFEAFSISWNPVKIL